MSEKPTKHFEFDLDDDEADELFACIRKEIVSCLNEIGTVVAHESRVLDDKKITEYEKWFNKRIKSLRQLKEKIKYTEVKEES